MDSNPASPQSLSPSTPRSFAHSEDDPRSPFSPSNYILDDEPLPPPQPTNTTEAATAAKPHSPQPHSTKPHSPPPPPPQTPSPKDVKDGKDVKASSVLEALGDNDDGDGGMVSAAVNLKEYDENGERRVVDYYINERGQYIKRTRVMRLVRKNVRVNKMVAERRAWSKFGDCAGLPAGPEPNITTKSSEIIHLDLRPKVPSPDGLDVDSAGANAGAGASGAGGGDRKSRSTSTFAAVLQKNEGKLVVCSNCGEPGHWSLKCPKRSTMEPPNFDSLDKPTPSASSADSGRTSSTGVYVPSYLRDNNQQRQWDDGPTIRVTNLSENATEGDLRELCLLTKPTGRITRLYLAKDRNTRQSRGFAFVTFEKKEDAQNAINKLHRHPYDNLILAVEWSKPRTNNNNNNNNNNSATATQKRFHRK